MASGSSPSRGDSALNKLTNTRAPAATIAGFLEIGIFHPFDTVAKRLMTNKTSLFAASDSQQSLASKLNAVVFKHHAQSSALQKVLYLYPGSFYAVIYKVFQRIYKFAGQPLVRDYIDKHHRHSAAFTWLGAGQEQFLREGTAGCLIGMGEVFLLPLDRLKVLSQVNEAAMKKGLVALVRQEGIRGMYTGIGITICRNAPGSFALFGGAAFTKNTIFGLRDEHHRLGSGEPKKVKASVAQNMAASCVGACLSITVSNPMDVIKTRMQHATHDVRVSTGKTIALIIREEGVFFPFFKGLTPKILASAPKLIFTYSMTEYLYHAIQSARRE